MEFIGHILWAGYLKGFTLPIMLGTLLPDLCLHLFFVHHRSLPADRFEHRLWKTSERLHSIFFVASAFLLAYLLDNSWLISFSFGWGLHVFIDLLMHRREGARYFYPFRDRKCSIGLFHWDNKTFIALNYVVLAFLYASRYVYHAH